MSEVHVLGNQDCVKAAQILLYQALRSRGKELQALVRSTPRESESEDATCNWAQCDQCGKWRRLPLEDAFSPENLPDEWFCHMNPNGQRNTCDKPEERMAKEEVHLPHFPSPVNG